MYPSKLEAIGIKSEVTQNTAVVPAATDFFLAEDVQVKVVQQFIPREFKHLSLDKLAHQLGSVYVDVTFKMQFMASGVKATAYTPLSTALQACKMNETIVPSTSITYAPISARVSASFFTIGKSVTIEYYEGATLTQAGVKKIIKGCVASGGPKITLEVDKYPMIEFSFRGLYTAWTDAVVPAVTYLAQNPPKVEALNFMAQGFAAIITKLEIDLGCVATMRKDANSTDGVKGFATLDWDPKGSFDPEGELMATESFIAKMRSGVEGQISAALGSVAGQITTITMPKCQYQIPDPAERDGMRTYALPFKINQNSGDDCITIVQT
jgi:hypothetical protein